MFRFWSRLSSLDLCALFESNARVLLDDFPLFSLLMFGDKTRTDLRAGLIPSGVLSKRFFAGFVLTGVDIAAVFVEDCKDSLIKL